MLSSRVNYFILLGLQRNLKAIHSLAQQHLKCGEKSEAISALPEMLRDVKVLHGEHHYYVGTVLHNISTVYMRAGLYRKAISNCRQAADGRHKSLRAFHLDLACFGRLQSFSYHTSRKIRKKGRSRSP